MKQINKNIDEITEVFSERGYRKTNWELCTVNGRKLYKTQIQEPEFLEFLIEGQIVQHSDLTQNLIKNINSILNTLKKEYGEWAKVETVGKQLPTIVKREEDTGVIVVVK